MRDTTTLGDRGKKPGDDPNLGGGGPGGQVPYPPANGTPPGGRGPIIKATGPQQVSFQGGPTPASTAAIGGQTAGYNMVGKTPFMQTPGMQIASQRENGSDITNDPAISAALKDFQTRIQPGIQNQSNLSGLGRSSANLNAISQAEGSMMTPFYQDAFAREQARTNRMGTAAENELGRQERSSARVSDANQNMASMLANLSQNQYNRGQTTGQNLMGAGGQLRDITQSGNAADLQDYLRRQSLAESAVLTPFGGLASGGLGSITNTTGK